MHTATKQEPDVTTLGAGLFLPFIVVMLAVVLVGSHSWGEKVGIGAAFIAIPSLILLLQKRAERSRLPRKR